MILSNLRIITSQKEISSGSIVINDGVISEIHETNIDGGIDMNGHICMPGFIDMHIHGLENNDVLDGGNALVNVSNSLLKQGVTSFLPTTLTLDIADVEEKLIYLTTQYQKVKGAKVLGIHLEGPFINKDFKGAQNPDFIKGATKELFDRLNVASDHKIRIVSYAPERTNQEFTQYCYENNVVPSVAHSNATFTDIENHYEVGLKSITHYHNAQSGHHHRRPGVVTAGFYFDINAELICDGLHLDKDVVRTIFKIKGREQLTLISDSTKPSNMPNGKYELGGLKVVKDDNTARLEDGSLAGSILNYNIGVRNFKTFTGCSLVDLVHVSSFNQARLLNETRLGDIKVGNKADIVILDSSFEVVKTIVDGKVLFSRDN